VKLNPRTLMKTGDVRGGNRATLSIQLVRNTMNQRTRLLRVSNYVWSVHGPICNFAEAMAEGAARHSRYAAQGATETVAHKLQAVAVRWTFPFETRSGDCGVVSAGNYSWRWRSHRRRARWTIGYHRRIRACDS